MHGTTTIAIASKTDFIVEFPPNCLPGCALCELAGGLGYFSFLYVVLEDIEMSEAKTCELMHRIRIDADAQWRCVKPSNCGMRTRGFASWWRI
jgi:hypothetical protein